MRYVAAAVCALLLASAPISRADGKDGGIAAMAARLDALEKLVVNDPLNPDRTVLSRLKSVEQKSQALGEAGAAHAKAEGRVDDAVEKSLTQTQRTLEQLERRLRTAEQAQAAGPGGAELKELSRQVKQLQSAVDALKDRVSKLERAK